MVLKIGKNGESDVTDIIHIDQGAVSYHYKGDQAKELIKVMHQALVSDYIPQINMITKLKVKPNKFKRTFTIRKYQRGRVIAKYRTNQFTIDEFEEMEYNTENDWKDYMKNNDLADLL